jgi:3-hydroxybutyrate dehydrogenase
VEDTGLIGIPENSVALIAGGAGGVGISTARALTFVGITPVLLGRDLDRLDEAVEALGAGTQRVVADVTDREAVDAAVAWTTENVGPPAILVNAAGMAESSPLLPPDDDLWDRTMAVNAKGGWHLATACIPSMKRAFAGFICNVASTAALQGYRYTAAYVASKHALLGLSRALVEDLRGTGIRVTTVCPGFLDSPMTDRTVARIVETTGGSEADARKSLARMNPSGQLISPHAVAAVVMELLRDSAAHGREVRLD